MSKFNLAVEKMFIAITFAEHGIEAPASGHEEHLALQARREAFVR